MNLHLMPWKDVRMSTKRSLASLGHKGSRNRDRWCHVAASWKHTQGHSSMPSCSPAPMMLSAPDQRIRACASVMCDIVILHQPEIWPYLQVVSHSLHLTSAACHDGMHAVFCMQ